MSAPATRGLGTAQRRGACPSLSAPMETGDGLLVRLNPLDGAISSGDLGAIAQAAARFGNGMLEITARGSLQIRGLTAMTAPELARFVDGLDLAVRDGVPVETAPLAGLDPHEIADPRPLAEAIREGAARLGLVGRLGPKVSVVVDGGGRSMLDGVKADVRLTAVRDGDAGVVWRLALVGDAAGGQFIADFIEADACAAALHHLAAIAALGKLARAKDLPGRDTDTPRFVGREAGVLPFGTRIPLADSRSALRVALPFGSIDAQTFARFADALAALDVIELRLSPERSLLVLCATDAQAVAACSAARVADLVVDVADPRLAVVACAGAPACASAHYATRRLAGQIAREASELLAANAKLHLSGCDKRCAEPSGQSITLIGRPDDCEIVANGTSVPPALREYLARRVVVQDRRAS
jgi:precorrin-3B synthase